MASRMDRYYNTSVDARKRSHRNETLYDSIYDDSTEYSNVEGIARIEKTNEIDIRRIREMLKKEEEKKHSVREQPIFKKRINIPNFEDPKDNDNSRNYDIMDILSQAKKNKDEEDNDKYRNLKNTQYNILKNLKVKKDDNSDSKEELQELINTISSKGLLDKLNDKELSLDLLDDLKSDNTTTNINKGSIKKLLEEEKEKQKENTDDYSDATELDKSFFTSSLNFSDEDFEELKDISTTYHKNNKLIKLLIAIIIIAVIVMIVLYFVKLPK